MIRRSRKNLRSTNDSPSDSRRAEDEVICVPIAKIKPSPENDEIYGAIDPNDVELIKLVDDIIENGIREPLVVSIDGFILSGHRRFAAATRACLKELPVRRSALRRADMKPHEWKRELVSFNKQRVKTSAVRMKEAFTQIDPILAHHQLVIEREKRDKEAPDELPLNVSVKRPTISDAKRPMLDSVIRVINEIKSFWPLTVRQVHYRLLNNPPLRHSKKPTSVYTNDRQCYSDLCSLIARARLSNEIPWKAIADETRPVSGIQFPADVAEFFNDEIHWFLKGYRRNLLQSQPDHIEVIAEKMTVQGILQPLCDGYTLPLTIGRGYCSLEPRRAVARRYLSSGKDRLVLLLVSDSDPDGDSISESFARSLRDDFGIRNLRPIRALLTRQQVNQWKLPPNAMEAKTTSARYASFFAKHGTNSVYELEAIEPHLLQTTLQKVIESVLDLEAFNREIANEREDAAKLAAIKKSVADHLAEIWDGFD